MPEFFLDENNNIKNKGLFDSSTLSLLESRLNICLSCESHYNKIGLLRCRECGCALNFILPNVYELDQDGKAFKTFSNGRVDNLFGLKKW